jgi:hypothetical protein
MATTLEELDPPVVPATVISYEAMVFGFDFDRRDLHLSFSTDSFSSAVDMPGALGGNAQSIVPLLREISRRAHAESNPLLLNPDFRCFACGEKATTGINNFAASLDQVPPIVRNHIYVVCARQECDSDVRVMTGQIADAIGPGKRVVTKCWNEGCVVTTGLQHCATCKVASYCSREHQTADWKRHKSVCRAP